MPTGIILLDKPQGLTSNGALQRVRKAYRRQQRRSRRHARSDGHRHAARCASTRPPRSSPKSNPAPSATNSPCSSARAPIPAMPRAAVVEQAAGARARRRARRVGAGGLSRRPAQVPPMYSALKRDGPAAVRAGAPGHRSGARRRAPSKSGGSNCWPARPTRWTWSANAPRARYIRVLGEDIARKLGTCGHLTRLRRAWVEPFRDMPMFTLEAVLAGAADASGPAGARCGAARRCLQAGVAMQAVVRCGTGRRCCSDAGCGVRRATGLPLRARRGVSGPGRGACRTAGCSRGD